MLCISKWFLHFNFLILLFWITSVYIKLIMYIFLKHIFFYLLVFHLNTPAFAKNALFQFANILSFYIIMFSPISLNLFMAINFVNLYTCTASNSPIVYMPMNMKKNYHIFVAHTLMPWIMCLSISLNLFHHTYTLLCHFYYLPLSTCTFFVSCTHVQPVIFSYFTNIFMRFNCTSLYPHTHLKNSLRPSVHS